VAANILFINILRPLWVRVSAELQHAGRRGSVGPRAAPSYIVRPRLGHPAPMAARVARLPGGAHGRSGVREPMRTGAPCPRPPPPSPPGRRLFPSTFVKIDSYLRNRCPTLAHPASRWRRPAYSISCRPPAITTSRVVLLARWKGPCWSFPRGDRGYAHPGAPQSPAPGR